MSLKYTLSLARIINCEIGLICCRRLRECACFKEQLLEALRQHVNSEWDVEQLFKERQA